jgi:ABC-2 type transport system ATP-binding protein
VYVQVDSAGQDAHAVLATVPGVVSVDVAGSEGPATAYEVHGAAGRDVRRDVAAAIVTRGWGLLELRQLRVSLEDVFLNLTTEEQAPVAAADVDAGAGAAEVEP